MSFFEYFHYFLYKLHIEANNIENNILIKIQFVDNKIFC